MRNKKTKMIFAVVLLLAVGFAAVSTTLVLNGNLMLGVNLDDFDVYFSNAILDDENHLEYISADGKSIIFSSKELSKVGDVSTLEYEVTNNSTQYDASVEIECVPTETEYMKIDNSIEKDVIEAQEVASGTVTMELLKNALDEITESFTCTLTVTAIEKTTVADVDVNTNNYSMGGYLYNENEEVLANKTMVVYSETPNYVTTDAEGYFYVGGLEKGSHEVYYMGDKTIEELKELSKDEIEETALSVGYTTTSSTKIEMSNNYKVNDFIIGDKESIDVITIKVGDVEVSKIAETNTLEMTIEDTEEYSMIMCDNNTIPSVEGNKVTLSEVKSTSTCQFYNDMEDVATQLKNSSDYYMVVLNDVSATKRFLIVSNLTIDLNGKIMNGTNSADSFLDVSGNNLEFNVLDSIGTGKVINEYRDCITVSGQNSVVNSNVDVEAGRSTYRIYRAGENSTINISGGNIKCTSAGGDTGCIYATSATEIINVKDVDILSVSEAIESNEGTINIENSSIVMDETASEAAVSLYTESSKINITNSKVINVDGMGISNKGNVTITNSLIKSVNNVAVHNTGNGVVTINGDDVVLNENNEYLSGMYVYSNAADTATIYNYHNTGVITVNGGTVYHDHNENGTWRQIAMRSDGGTINIRGGVIKTDGYVSSDNLSLRTFFLGSNSVVNITGGQIVGNIAANYDTSAYENPTTTVYICGGTITGHLHVGNSNGESQSRIYYKNSGINWANETGKINIYPGSENYVIEDNSITCGLN